MADIAMCNNRSCPYRLGCHRHTTVANPYGQSVMDFTFRDGACPGYVRPYFPDQAVWQAAHLSGKSGDNAEIRRLKDLNSAHTTRVIKTATGSKVPSEKTLRQLETDTRALLRDIAKACPPDTGVVLPGDPDKVLSNYLLFLRGLEPEVIVERANTAVRSSNLNGSRKGRFA